MGIKEKKTRIRKSGNKLTMHCHWLEAARRDAIGKLKSLWGFASELQTNPMPFHLDSLYVKAAWSVYDGVAMEQDTEGRWKLQSYFSVSTFVDQSSQNVQHCRGPFVAVTEQICILENCW